ncbi:MAG: hypothetical protein ABIQ78_03730 [Dokdonella sp.]
MNPLKDPEDLGAATLLINQYAASDWTAVSYTLHAREMLAKRAIPQGVLEIVLRSGAVVECRTGVHGTLLQHCYKVRWVDKFGAINAITVIPGFHKLRIVTIFPDESDDDTW